MYFHLNDLPELLSVFRDNLLRFLKCFRLVGYIPAPLCSDGTANTQKVPFDFRPMPCLSRDVRSSQVTHFFNMTACDGALARWPVCMCLAYFDKKKIHSNSRSDLRSFQNFPRSCKAIMQRSSDATAADQARSAKRSLTFPSVSIGKYIFSSEKLRHVNMRSCNDRSGDRVVAYICDQYCAEVHWSKVTGTKRYKMTEQVQGNFWSATR